MAGKPGIKFDWLDKSLHAKLEGAQDKANRYLAKLTEMEGFRTEAAAKKGAKWTDRTGNARSGLSVLWEARFSSEGGEFSVELYHTEDYGFFLEVVNFTRKGDLSIIKPTLDQRGPIFMSGAQKILDRIFT